MSLLDAMPHLVDIQHIGYSQPADELGGDVEITSAPYAVDEPAWLQVASASEVKMYAARNQDVILRCYLQRDPGFRLPDRLQAKDGADVSCPYAGKWFSVLAFSEATVGFGLLWKAIIKQEQEA